MKTIVTVDKADQPYGFPQASEQGYLTSSKVSGPFGNNSVVSASYALTASFALNGGGGGTIDTSSLVTTASFNAFTASYNTGSFSGSFIGVFSGSLLEQLAGLKTLSQHPMLLVQYLPVIIWLEVLRLL